VGAIERVGTTKVVRTVGRALVGRMLVDVLAGVAVGGKRGSVVMVGTGDNRATCSVAMRSCGAPVAWISQIICIRIDSSIGGMAEGCASPL